MINFSKPKIKKNCVTSYSIILFTVFSLTNSSLFAQNIFPNIGNAGIGTLTPNEALHIASGTLKIDQFKFDVSAPVSVIRSVGFDKNGGLHGNVDTNYKFELPTTAYFDLNFASTAIPQNDIVNPAYLNSAGGFVFPTQNNPLGNLAFYSQNSLFSGNLTLSNGNLVLSSLVNSPPISLANSTNVYIAGIDKDGKVVLINSDLSGGVGTGNSNNAWLLSGNRGTTTANFIGTLDNQDLSFKTNSLQRLKIYNYGGFEFTPSDIFIDGNLGTYASDGTITPLISTEIIDNDRKFLSCSSLNNQNFIQEKFFVRANGSAYFDEFVDIGFNRSNTYRGNYKLAVNGTIFAKEIRVTTKLPFPDYVFDKNYELMPIKEVENFIMLNNHLPKIPSAKDIEKANGVDLGEMNLLLLEKIEELTLYVIKLSKENDEIKKELLQLKK